MRKLLSILLCVLVSGFVYSQKPITPSEGFKETNVIESQTKFASFDVHGKILYANKGDSILCYNIETWEQVKFYLVPDDYRGNYSSFTTLSPDGKTIWVGYTTVGNLNDRIYSIDVESGVWEHKATFASNFDLDFWKGKILVSGLNSSEWTDPNSIFLLDTIGSNNHKKLIEIGGSSSGFSVDKDGNIYNSPYNQPYELLKWKSDAIKNIIDGVSSEPLKRTNAAKLSDLPAGAYDCDFDDVGNLIFDYNSQSGTKGIAVWNGTEGVGNNYDVIATATSWMGMIKAFGDIKKHNENNGLFLGIYNKPLFFIHKDAPFEIINPIGTITAATGEEFSKDISNVADDIDDEVVVTCAIESYDESLFSELKIENKVLKIIPKTGIYKESDVNLKFTANGESVTDKVTIKPVTGMAEIKNWVGTGSNKAAFVLQWNDEKQVDTLIWGFRWDGDATGEDMVKAIAKKDPRFYYLVKQGTQYGSAIGGFAYDINLKDTIIVENPDGEFVKPKENAIVTTEEYDFDDWSNKDKLDHWQSGWKTKGYWSYYVRKNTYKKWGYSNVGVSNRKLENGCWDAWNFAVNMQNSLPGVIMNPAPTDEEPPVVANPIPDINLTITHEDITKIDISKVFTDPDNNDIYITKKIVLNSDESFVEATVSSKDLIIKYLTAGAGESKIVLEAMSSGKSVTDTFTVKVEDIDYLKGVFIVNEDWFGHDLSSVNFLRDNGEVVYRAYRHQNPSKKLGNTTQFGTIYGNKVYFVSKQEPRLVVADANNLKGEVSIDKIGGADGRAFLGVNESMGYVSTSDGIYKYSMTNQAVGEKIEGTDGETGNMLLANGYVFAVQQARVIILKDDKVISTIKDENTKYAGLARTIDGHVWIGAETKLLKVNPYTLAKEYISIPAEAKIQSPWFAWTANSLCASPTENVLFWAENSGWKPSKKIFKYIVGDDSSLDSPFITLSGDWCVYGAGLRVHPITNQMYVTAKKSGWGSNSLKNQIQIFDTNNASLISSTDLEDYYWFPAMPMFPDVYEPIANLSDTTVKDNNIKQLKISLVKSITDKDNLDVGIITKVSSVSNANLLTSKVKNDTLFVDFKDNKFGTSAINLSINSNGKIITHSFNVNREEVTSIESTLNQNGVVIYPNPSDGIFKIKTGLSKLVSVKIYDMRGVLVYVNDNYSVGNVVDVSNLSSGQYVISIVSEGNMFKQKIVIKK